MAAEEDLGVVLIEARLLSPTAAMYLMTISVVRALSSSCIVLYSP